MMSWEPWLENNRKVSRTEKRGTVCHNCGISLDLFTFDFHLKNICGYNKDQAALLLIRRCAWKLWTMHTMLILSEKVGQPVSSSLVLIVSSIIPSSCSQTKAHFCSAGSSWVILSGRYAEIQCRETTMPTVLLCWILLCTLTCVNNSRPRGEVQESRVQPGWSHGAESLQTRPVHSETCAPFQYHTAPSRPWHSFMHSLSCRQH